MSQLRHPLLRLPSASRNRLFITLLVLSLLMMLVMNQVGAQLNTPAAPNGIVSFELAGSIENTRQILASWDAQAQLHAAFIQGLDFLFLCVYSTTFALGCLMASSALRDRQWPLAGLGLPLAWGMWLAAALDAVENIALVVLLFGRLQPPWPRIAWTCAVLKFSLLSLGLVYLFYGAVVRMAVGARKDRPRPQPSGS